MGWWVRLPGHRLWRDRELQQEGERTRYLEGSIPVPTDGSSFARQLHLATNDTPGYTRESLSQHVLVFIPEESWFLRRGIPGAIGQIPIIGMLVGVIEHAISGTGLPPLTVTIAGTPAGCYVTFSGFARRLLIERFEAALAASGMAPTQRGESISLEELIADHQPRTQATPDQAPSRDDATQRKCVGIVARTVRDLREAPWWVYVAIVFGLLTTAAFFWSLVTGEV